MENSQSQKNMFYILRYAIPCISALVLYWVGTKILEQPGAYWLIIAVLFAGVWVITYPKQYKRLVTRQVNRMINEGDNSSIFGQKCLEIADGVLTVKGEQMSEAVSLDGVKDIKVYEDMILIYIASIVAHIIPRRYLDEETEQKLLKELGYDSSY